jgi:hypothetical protein
MIEFKETRWQPPLAWLVLAVIFMFALSLPGASTNGYVRIFLSILVVACFACAVWKILNPSVVVSFNDGGFRFRGVRPGWWKFVQLWKIVDISDRDIVDIRLGKIREQHWFGTLPPLGEPSKGSEFQKFLWIRYVQNERNEEIYYPDVGNIRDSEALVRLLKERFKDRVIVFPPR